MINFNSTSVGKVMYENTPVKKIIQDGVVLWNSAYHYDVTSIALDTSHSVDDSNTQDFLWNNDGTSYYTVGGTGDYIREYSTTIAYDLNGTLTQVAQYSVAGESLLPTAMTWAPDGLTWTMTDYTNRKFHVYKVTGSAWDLESSTPIYSSADFGLRVFDIEWNGDGTEFILYLNNDRFRNYTVSTPYSASLYNSTHTAEWISPAGYKFSGANWNADGTQMICNDETGERLCSFDFSGSYEIESNHNQTDQLLTSFGGLTAAVTQATTNV